jgi:tape measure domain-containing protein
MEIARIRATVGVDISQARRGLTVVRAEAQSAGRALDQIEKNDVKVDAGKAATDLSRLALLANQAKSAFLSLKSAGGGGFGAGLIGGISGAALVGVADKILDIGKSALTAGIDYNSLMEKSRLAFTVLMKDASKANAHIKDLTIFAEQTPFRLEDVLMGSRRLQAFGVQAKVVVPTLRALSDAVSSVGGGRDQFEGLLRNLGQIRNSTRLQGDELTQIGDLGINVFDILSKVTGKSEKTLRELQAKGKLSGRGVADALLEGFRQEFGGLSEAFSGTLEGKISNLKDLYGRRSGEATKDAYGELKMTVDSGISSLNSPGGGAFVQGLGTATNVATISLNETIKLLSGNSLLDKARVGGSNIIEGLKSGISSKLSEAKEALGGVSSGMFGEFLSFWGIQSPSKVMIEKGEEIIEGLKIGLERGDKAGVQAALKEALKAPNVRAALDTIKKAEHADYDTLFGGGKFTDFSKHPGFKGARYKGKIQSASGAYQIQRKTYRGLREMTGLSDFSPETQDMMAVALLYQRGALGNILRGDFKGGFWNSRKEWASFPGAGYGQGERSQAFMARAVAESLARQGVLVGGPRRSNAFGTFTSQDAAALESQVAPRRSNRIGDDASALARILRSRKAEKGFFERLSDSIADNSPDFIKRGAQRTVRGYDGFQARGGLSGLSDRIADSSPQAVKDLAGATVSGFDKVVSLLRELPKFSDDKKPTETKFLAPSSGPVGLPTIKPGEIQEIEKQAAAEQRARLDSALPTKTKDQWFKDLTQQGDETAKKLKAAFEQNLGTFFTDIFSKGPKAAFADMLRAWGQTLIQMAAQALAARLTRKLFGGGEDSEEGGGGGGLGGIFSGFFGGLFGGGRANGGPVSGGGGGRVFRINERESEWLYMERGARGRVFNSRQMDDLMGRGQAGPQQVSFNINLIGDTPVQRRSARQVARETEDRLRRSSIPI